MTAFKTQIGAKDRATDVPFDPLSDVPATNVWDALVYVWNYIKSALATVTSTLTALAAPQYLVSAASADLTNERVATDTATVTWDFTGAGLARANVPDAGITNAKLRNSSALSIIGRSANSIGVPADIAAASDDTLLRRVAGALGFGQLTAGMVPNNLISTAMLADSLITFAKLAAALYDTDGTLSGNSDSKFATQKAVKTYVDTLAAVVSGALVFKGAFDASAGSFPGGGTAQTGYFYRVSVAGTVNGVAFDVGDDIYAITNNASTSTYAGNWLLIEGVLSSAEIIAALSNGALAYAKIQNVSATDKVLGRQSAGAGVIEEISCTSSGRSMIAAASAAAQTALLSAVVGDSGSGGTKGLVPAPGSGDAAAGKYLAAGGGFSVPPTLASTAAAIGYAAGAGGTVTQATSKSTGVTLNKPSGVITLNGAALASGAYVNFILTNSFIAANDLVLIDHTSTGTEGQYDVGTDFTSAGSVKVYVGNTSAGSLSEAIKLSFAVIKVATT